MFNRSRLMRFLRSLRFRLTLWSLLILTLVLAVFSAFVYTRQANDLQAATADQLGVLTDATLSYLKMNHDQFLASGRVQLDLSSLALGKVAKVEPNAIIVLVGLNGEAVQQVGPLDRDAGARLLKLWFLDSPNRGGVQMTVTPVDSATPQNYTFLLTKADFTDLGVGGALVGLPTDSGGQLPRLAWTLFSGSLLLLLADLGIGYWLAGRLMQPVQAITHTAQSIGETDLSQRLNLRTGDELGELADTFDRMLERLEAAFARQRQFTSDASHELRTPLTIVGLETNRALAQPRSPAEYRQALTIIQSENESMSRLVDDLLTLARADAGRGRLTLEPLDFSEVILDVVERLRPLAQSQAVRLQMDELPELPINGDRRYLEQLLANVIENGIKYGYGADRWVRVEAGCPTIATDQLIWVRVTDNGLGIPAQHLSHIFDRFYRVDQARSEAGGEAPGGSGLGLSIVQWIAEAHGGQVTAQSSGVPGEGTLFEIRLPVIH